MPQKMTWKEIKKSFPDEWVAIANFVDQDETPYGAIVGEVIAHNKNEKVFTGQLKKISPETKTIDIRFTGEILPENPVGPILWQISDTNS